MGFVRRTLAVAAAGASCVLTYYAYEHWTAVTQYPRETRDELREAVCAEREGRSGDAERGYHAALQSCGRATGAGSAASQSILIKMADFYRERGSLDRAARIYEGVLAAGDAQRMRAGRVAEVQKTLGDVYVELGRLEDADGVLAGALAALNSSPKLAKNPALLGPVLESIGDLRFKQGRFGAAAEAYASAAGHCAADDGATTQAHVTLLNNVASCYFALRTPESLAQAADTAETALRIATKIRTQPGVGELIANLQTILDNASPDGD